jgi:hypothetical protein
LTLLKSVVDRSSITAVCCYNHARAKIGSSQLIGPTVTGVEIFTGGWVECSDTAILGMTGPAIRSHLGGSGDFSSLLVSPVDIGPVYLFKNESQRPMSIQLVGQPEPMTWNASSLPAAKGTEAVPPRCKGCGGPATDCVFAPCGHSIYCRECWDRLPQKPQSCELCVIPIDAVSRLIDCSADDSAGICPICYSTEADSVILPCGHQVCHECGEHWVITNSTCPFCRTSNPHVRWKVSYA